MADTVSNITITNTAKRIVTRHISRSDGTGETAVVKVDKSTLTGLNKVEPSYFKIIRVEYNVSGMEVLVSADATTDRVLFRLQGTGFFDFEREGGLSTSASGDTGDILFTTNGHSAGDTYDITLSMVKHD